MQELTGLIQAIVIVLLFVLAILWILVPFAVFGCLKHLSVIRQYMRMAIMSLPEDNPQDGTNRLRPEKRRSLVDMIWPP